MYAHASGFNWDEGLMVLAPIAAVCGLLMLARRRRSAMAAQGTDALCPTVRIVLATACLLGAQLLHWSVIDQHAREWSAAGDFFFGLVLLEGLMTVLVVVRLRPWVAAAGILVSVVPVLVWAWDRTLGLPFGPNVGVRGTIGRSDVMSVVFEVLTVLALWPFLRRSAVDRRSPRLDLVGRALVGGTVVYVLGFSMWAMLADDGATHEEATTRVVDAPQFAVANGFDATSAAPAGRP